MVAVEAKSNPAGDSGAEMACQSCSKFGQGGWAFVPPHQPMVTPRVLQELMTDVYWRANPSEESIWEGPKPTSPASRGDACVNEEEI